MSERLQSVAQPISSPTPHGQSERFTRGPAGPAGEEFATLSDSQKEILAMLEERPVAAKAEEAPVVRHRGFGLDVACASLGALSILSGIVLLFFFAALGSVVLVLGAILCAIAFERVALGDLAAEQAELDGAMPVLAGESARPQP